MSGPPYLILRLEMEGSMHEYEIRILKGDGSTGVVMQEIHLSAEAAIKKARRLARERSFEVWSDDRCIYSSDHSLPPDAPPNRPAA
jgi:hypothetical protein